MRFPAMWTCNSTVTVCVCAFVIVDSFLWRSPMCCESALREQLVKDARYTSTRAKSIDTLQKVFKTISILQRLVGIFFRQLLAFCGAVLVVFGAAYAIKMRHFMRDCTCF